MRGLVRVGADGHDRAAKVAVEPKDVLGGLGAAQAVAPAGGVDLDAAAARDCHLEDLCRDVAHVLEGHGARRRGVVAADEVQVCDDRPVVEVARDAQELLVVGERECIR